MEAFQNIGINVPGLITQIINFGLLLILLTVFLYRPITRMLDQRAERIRDALSQAERARQESARSQEEVQKALAEARERGQAIIQQAQEAGQRMEAQAREDARRQAEEMVERARNEIQRERDEAIEQVRGQFADLAIVAAERVVRRSLDRNAHRALVDEVLREARDGQSSRGA